MTVLSIIPAQFLSSRLPGKPLKALYDRSLIEHVWQRLDHCGLTSACFVATDNQAIEHLCKKFNAPVVLVEDSTNDPYSCAYKALLKYAADSNTNIESIERILLVPCTLPFLETSVLEKLLRADLAEEACISTAVPITTFHDFVDPRYVKVVFRDDNKAVYFSRAPLPFSPKGYDTEDHSTELNGGTVYGFRDLGVQTLRPSTLKSIQNTPMQNFELVEDVHQLRLLVANIPVSVVPILDLNSKASFEVTDPDSLRKAEDLYLED
jgi:3-deoxy-manno-octulosonate cytidylyltransferase (CMP-KDO synthetase)